MPGYCVLVLLLLGCVWQHHQHQHVLRASTPETRCSLQCMPVHRAHLCFSNTPLPSPPMPPHTGALLYGGALAATRTPQQ